MLVCIIQVAVDLRSEAKDQVNLLDKSVCCFSPYPSLSLSLCPWVSQNACMICQGLGVFSELMQSRFLHTFLSLPFPLLGRSVWSGFSFTKQQLQESARHAKNPPGRLQVHVLCHSRHDGAAAHGVLHGEQSDLKMSGLLRHTDCNIESYFWQPITNLHVPISHEIIFVLQAL